jgi:hypothetical protein
MVSYFKIISLVVLFTSVLFDYKIYQYVSIFLIIPIYLSGFKINSRLEKLLLLIPILFYLKKLFSAVTQNYEIWNSTTLNGYESIFPDMQATLLQIKCQSKIDGFTFNNLEYLNNECIFHEVRYGPLFNLVKIDLNESFFNYIYILLSILVFLFVLKIYKTSGLDLIFIYLLVLSPSFNLMFNQLNIDIILIILSYFFVKNIDSNFYPKTLLILIFALIKQHPIGFLIGLVFLEVDRNKKRYLYSLIGVFFIIYGYFVYIDNNFIYGQPRPSSMSNSIGLLSVSEYVWANLTDSIYAYRVVFIIYFIFFLISLAISKYYFKPLIIENNLVLTKFELASASWLLFCLIYANYDYRLVISFLFINLVKYLKIYKFSLVFLIYLSPFMTFENIIINNIQIYGKIFLFFIVLQILIRMNTNLLKDNSNNFISKCYRYLS